MQIAIDGPAGAGKSTVARKLATHLKILYLDTGAMYRTVTLAALRAGIPPEESDALHRLLAGSHIDFADTQEGQRVLLNDEDITGAIRTPDVSQNVSAYASLPSVRKEMTARQQKIAEARSVIMDGRDIGTVVLPEAEHKFFLVASAEERAERRAKDLAQMGVAVDMAQLIKDINERDRRDAGRALSPLQCAPDAVCIDTENLTENDVVNKILHFITK